MFWKYFDIQEHSFKINNYFHCKYCTNEEKDYATINSCDVHMHVLGQHKCPKGIFLYNMWGPFQFTSINMNLLEKNWVFKEKKDDETRIQGIF